MRLRIAVLASLLSVLVAALAPSLVSAAPRHNHGLTIAVNDRHIRAGEGVLIYGRLGGPSSGGQTIRLYHRIAGQPAFTLVSTATTAADGTYEFTRAEGVVDTNRAWFVRGPDRTHSRTIVERVDALVSLTADTSQTETLAPVLFTGSVYPVHRYQRVLLQEQVAGDDWRTIKTGFTGPGSSFRLLYRWRVPGAYTLRAVFPGDRRNARGASDAVALTVQQRQIDGFSILSDSPVIDYNAGSATIHGALDKAGALNAAVPVTLMARVPGSSSWTAVQNAVTGSDGSYSFTVSPATNTWYMVRATVTPKRHSAELFEGVRDAITASASHTTGMTGQVVTFTGSVLPGKAGAIVYLQRLGKDGDWHTVAVTQTNGSSAYSFAWTLGEPGTKQFRTRVLSDRQNIGNASAPITVTVTAPSSQASLPAAS